MVFDPSRPYDDLPLLPPPIDVETATVLKQCLKATRALAELKGAGGLIPDQAILINAIPLQEAQASSEIENILTTQDSLFRAALDESRTADPQTKEVLRYRTAPSAAHTKELVELLFRQPYCKIAFVVEAGIAKRQTAAAYLQALEEASLLTSESVGRERLFLNPALLDLLKKGTP